MASGKRGKGTGIPTLVLCVALLFGGLAVGVAVPFAALGAEGGAVILMYHRFGEDRYPSTSIRLEQFEAHLTELKRKHYRVRPVAEIVADLRAGRPLAPYTVGITIDDAFASVHSEAWPRLKAAGLPFTLFVATEPIDRRYKDMASWDDLRKMIAGGGVTIGNHSVRHAHMATFSPAAVREELEQAAARLTPELGAKHTLLAYPYGEFGLATRNAAVGMGFQAAFGQHSGAIGAQSDPFALPRFPLNERYGSLERLKEILRALPLPVSNVKPAETLLTPATNPPRFGFSVAEDAGPLKSLRCYLSGQGALTLEHPAPRRVEALLPNPLPPGRSRINCTLPAPEGRFRWFGQQFYLPAP